MDMDNFAIQPEWIEYLINYEYNSNFTDMKLTMLQYNSNFTDMKLTMLQYNNKIK